MPSPTRVGIVGLGKTTVALMPGGWGAGAHLPYLLASPRYELIAVANSSRESAQAAIDFHELGSNVKAYGSVEEMAQNPEVDFVVITVQVGSHYALAKPVLAARKDVFVEWPLAKTEDEEAELVSLAQSKGARTVVGAQGRINPAVAKMKELIISGKIGSVTSSTATIAPIPLPWATWPESAKYYLDIDSGGNAFTITFGHFFDTFVHVLGDFNPTSAVFRVDHPTANVVNAKGEVVYPNHPKTTPDHISAQGHLASGATASIVFGDPPVDGVGCRWVVTGTDGELQLTTPLGMWQMISLDQVILKARTDKSEAFSVVEFGSVADAAGVQRNTVAENVGRLYEAFANGDKGEYMDFGEARKVHRVLDSIKRVAA